MKKHNTYHKECKCGVKIIYGKTKKGENMPIRIDSLSDEDKLNVLDGVIVQYRYGDHVSHFWDCPFAESFRRKK